MAASWHNHLHAADYSLVISVVSTNSSDHAFVIKYSSWILAVLLLSLLSYLLLPFNFLTSKAKKCEGLSVVIDQKIGNPVIYQITSEIKDNTSFIIIGAGVALW